MKPFLSLLGLALLVSSVVAQDDYPRRELAEIRARAALALSGGNANAQDIAALIRQDLG